MGRLEGKIVLITGTARGNGRASALLFAREGAVVAGCDLDAAGAEETCSLVRAEGGRMTSTAPVDLGDLAAGRAWVDAVAAEHGGVDVLFNNASSPRVGPFAELTPDDWHHTIRNELDLVYFATRAAWHLFARGGGAVVNTASIAAVRGAVFTEQAAHGAAKGGVLAFTYHLAASGGPHRIRANAILPGMIRTPSTEFLFTEPDGPGVLAPGEPARPRGGT